MIQADSLVHLFVPVIMFYQLVKIGPAVIHFIFRLSYYYYRRIEKRNCALWCLLPSSSAYMMQLNVTNFAGKICGTIACRWLE
jgi:hypothetical protein